MRKPKAKKPSRMELRRRELAVISQIVTRHVSRAWEEAMRCTAETNPNGRVGQFNQDFCDELLGQFNMRRNWSKVIGKKAS